MVAQLVKNLPATQETWIREDPLEKEIATLSSILARAIPWTGSLADYRLWGCKESEPTEYSTVCEFPRVSVTKN